MSLRKFARQVTGEDKLLQIAAIVPNKEENSLLKIPIACKFPEVFPDDLPGLPPDKKIKFIIDLELGTHPISKAPY